MSYISREILDIVVVPFLQLFVLFHIVSLVAKKVVLKTVLLLRFIACCWFQPVVWHCSR